MQGNCRENVMSEKIGKLYTEAEIDHVARRRAELDAGHDIVIWDCPSCPKSIETPVAHKLTSRLCVCGTWMQWHYKAMQAA